MTRRARLIAGLVTFFALGLSFAEGVWASTCTPDMERTAPAAAHDDAPDRSNPMAGHDGDHDRGDGPDCPFGPAGTARSCVVAASLPAASVADVAPAPERAEAVVASEIEPPLLSGHPLFHPPKA